MVSCYNPAETKTVEVKDSANTVEEQTMTAKEEEGVMVGGAKIIASRNLLENLVESKEHTILLEAIKVAGLEERLSAADPLTIFAPNDAAFKVLPTNVTAELLQPTENGSNKKIINYHIVPGFIKIADLKDGQKLKTVQGQELSVSIKDSVIRINNSKIITADAESSNGVIHVIDAVLQPQ